MALPVSVNIINETDQRIKVKIPAADILDKLTGEKLNLDPGESFRIRGTNHAGGYISY